LELERRLEPESGLPDSLEAVAQSAVKRRSPVDRAVQPARLLVPPERVAAVQRPLA
jgi:hypothetical protein